MKAPEVVAATVRRVEGWSASLSAGTTRGQKETLAAIVLLAVVLTVWADPRTSVLTPAASSAATRRAPASTATGGGAASAVPQPDAGEGSTPLPTAAPPAVDTPLAPPDAAPALGLAATSSTARVVALARTGGATAGGRDDAAVAQALLPTAGMPITLVRDDGSEGVCAAAATAGETVVAHDALSRRLLDCLLGRGVTVLAYDVDGDQPAAGRRGQVVSSRRSVRSSIAALGSAPRRPLSGRVGIVAGRTVAAGIEAAARDLRSQGVEVVASSLLPESTSTAAGEIPASVLAMRQAGAQTVVFALPVEVQRLWAAQASVGLPGVRYVVADAFDAVVNEGYGPLLDGAVAHTTLVQRWLPRQRADGPAAKAATACVQAAGGASDAELVSVLTWCQHLRLVALAAQVGGPTAEVLRTLRLDSPLTSALAPGPEGWGPSGRTTVTWRAACGCWSE